MTTGKTIATALLLTTLTTTAMAQSTGDPLIDNPSALMSRMANPPAPVPAAQPPADEVGLVLDRLELIRLLWCVALGFCPAPGTPLNWGISGVAQPAGRVVKPRPTNPPPTPKTGKKPAP